MIRDDRVIVLDTWVLVHLCRNDAVGRDIVERYDLRSRSRTPIISTVTIGEMYAFARGRDWGTRRRSLLDDLLANLVTVDIGAKPILDAYAEISTWLREHGRAVGHNDRWIAATARALDAVVITGDRDFLALHPEMITCEWVSASGSAQN